MRIKFIPSNDKRTSEINEIIRNKFGRFVEENDPEIILVAGGDGALLHAIQQFNYLQVPFFGLAKGSLNFLMNQVEYVTKFINDLKQDRVDLHALETTSIKVQGIKNNGKPKLIGFAVNEVITGTTIMGYHHLSISSSDFMFDNFQIKGSGVCVATDLGSTAYNFNLGGPVLPLGSKLWSIKGIVCDGFLEDIMAVQKLDIKNISERTEVGVFLDGVENNIKLEKDDRLILSRGQTIKIAFLNKEDFLRRRVEIASRYRK